MNEDGPTASELAAFTRRTVLERLLHPPTPYEEALERVGLDDVLRDGLYNSDDPVQRADIFLNRLWLDPQRFANRDKLIRYG